MTGGRCSLASLLIGRVAALALLLACAAPAPVHAGWRTWLSRAPSTPLGEAERFVRGLPPARRAGALAVSGLAEGHWRLTNGAGEVVTARGRDELARALAWLAPRASDLGPAGAGARAGLRLYLSASTLFADRARLAELPPGTALHLVFSGRAYPLGQMSGPKGTVLLARVGRRLWVRLEDEPRLREALWQLRRPLSHAGLRVLSLDAEAPDRLARRVPRQGAAAAAPIEPVNPYRLARALGAAAGDLVLVSGRVEGDLLWFKGGRGPERSVLLNDVLGAGEAADANLLVLDAPSGRQPGTRNMLWLAAGLTGLDEAMRAGTLGGLLVALAGAGESPLVVSVEPPARRGTHVALRAEPVAGIAPSGARRPQGEGTGVVGMMRSLLTEVVASVSGDVSASRILARLQSAAHAYELSRRIVPGVPSRIQHAYVGLLTLGLLILPVALGWWRRLFEEDAGEDYRYRAAHLLARIIDHALFALVFLPLAAAPAFVVGAGRAMMGGLARRARGHGAQSGRSEGHDAKPCG